MIVNKFWCEYLWVAYVLFLDPFLYIVLVSSEVEACNIIDYMKKVSHLIFEVIFEFK